MELADVVPVFLKQRDHFRRVLLLSDGVLMVTTLAFPVPVSPRKVEKPQQLITVVSSMQKKMIIIFNDNMLY